MTMTGSVLPCARGILPRRERASGESAEEVHLLHPSHQTAVSQLMLVSRRASNAPMQRKAKQKSTGILWAKIAMVLVLGRVRGNFLCHWAIFFSLS